MKRSRLVLLAIVGILLYLAFIIYSNLGEVAKSFQQFNWILLPVILSLIFVGYLLRAWRWHYYLRTIDIVVSRRDSCLIFLAGQSMTITPGKVGELIKPYLLRSKVGAQVSVTVPVIIMERLTDLIGMILLAGFGLLSLQYGAIPLAISAALVATVVIVLQRRSLCLKILRALRRIPRLTNYSRNLETAYDSAHSLLGPKQLGVATLISLGAWGLEGLCLYLVFVGLGVEINLIRSISIFSLSSIVGAATMLPGGLGVTEGSMVALIVMAGAATFQATAATILIRLSTMWFAVVIGLVVLRRWFGGNDALAGKDRNRTDFV